MIIAYTIGHTKSYMQALTDDSVNAVKIGKRADYEGGWIWKTPEEAQAFIGSREFLDIDWGDGKKRNPEDFSVFGVRLTNGYDDIGPIAGKVGTYTLLYDREFFAI